MSSRQPLLRSRQKTRYPVELVLGAGQACGCRQSTPGSQTIRLVFDQAERLKRMSLVFEENETARTQEFVLRPISFERLNPTEQCHFLRTATRGLM
jgi:hypothetical protein